jgi:signal transduction histidine kinase
MQSEGNQILTLFISSTALILIIIILAFTFIASYQKKIVVQKLRIQDDETRLQQKLLQASINSQEIERKRIAADLHDEIGSLLSSMRSNMNHLKTIEAIPKDEKAFIEHAGELIDNGLKNVRRISYDLLPPTLVKFGLYEALQEMVNEVNLLSHVAIASEIGALNNESFSDHLNLSIYRVFKELISNSLKEKTVSKINIQCQLSNELIFEYSDNGNGFSSTQQTEGLGIINMKSRIHSILGTIEFSTEDDDFFAANIRIPLNTIHYDES